MRRFFFWAAIMLMVPAGFNWDVQWHFTKLRESLWIPPHIMVMGGVALSILLGYVEARRAGPYQSYLLRAVWLALGFYGALGLDEVFHRILGPDNSIWSPSHRLMSLTLTGAILMGYRYVRTLYPAAPNASWQVKGLHTLLLVVTLDGLVGVNTQPETAELFVRLHGLAYGDTVMAIPVSTLYGAPLWVYPLYTVLAFSLIIIFARSLFPWRYGATLVAGGYTLFRSLQALMLAANDFTYPFPPFHFLITALVVDWLLPDTRHDAVRIPVVMWLVALVWSLVMRPLVAIPPYVESFPLMAAVGAAVAMLAGRILAPRVCGWLSRPVEAGQR